MSSGHAVTSPWTYLASDYQSRTISISVPFNEVTGALSGCTVSRDDGCQYNTIVIDVPDSPNAKRLPAPVDGAGPATYTAQQMKSRGLNTISDVTALQITAEP